MDGKPHHIAVLMGGKSTEREVSLRTGEQIAAALTVAGYQVTEIDTGSPFISQLQKCGPDVAFIALHGRFGEDGTIQGMLELLGIPYVGSGVLASALGMDKVVSKKILVAEGIRTPEYRILTKREIVGGDLNQTAASTGEQLGYPLVVKPANQGSTIGISFPNNHVEMEKAIREALKYDDDLLIEAFIKGMEVTAPVLGIEELRVLPLIEIISDTGVYDYEAKYNLGISHHIIPARLPEQTRVEIEELALRTFRALGCRQLARVDFMLDSNYTPYVLETNTIPGMTETSLFPDSAKHDGISFRQLVSLLVDDAWSLAAK